MRKVYATGLLAMAVSAHADIQSNTITQTTITQNKEMKVKASNWGLTQTEYQKYQQLMQQTPAQFWFKGVDPVQVLGLMASSEAERMHYAVITAKLVYKRIGDELQFQRDYHKAFMKLYGDQPIVQGIPGTDAVPIENVQPNDRLELFTSVENPVSDMLVERLMARVEKMPGLKLDIYFTGNANDSAIQAWAKRNMIPLFLVNSRVVNLNHAGPSNKAQIRNQHEPLLFLTHNGKQKEVSLNSV